MEICGMKQTILRGKKFEVIMYVNIRCVSMGGRWGSGDRFHGLSNTSLIKSILQIVPEDI